MNNNTKLKILPYVSLAFAATGTLILNFMLPSYPNIFIWMEFIYLTYNVNQYYLQGLYIDSAQSSIENFRLKRKKVSSMDIKELRVEYAKLCDEQIEKSQVLTTSFLGEKRNFTMFAMFTIYGILNSTGLSKWLLSFIGG